MPIHLLLPFINDAYYYRETFDEVGPHTYSSLQRQNYRQLFYDDDYDISVLGNLINETDSVKMIAYNVINKDKDIELTILSIKGTTFNKDIYLDAQLFISSVLMTLLNTFSLISQKSLFSFKIMEYSLSIPYRIFFKYLIVDEYLNKLKNAYNNNEFKFYNNVVIVGHSLGGGLAKLFGRMIKKQGISLSGPGINAFNSLWNYEGESENFEISAIDLVPDRDLVPRVEVSGGTIYRIICKFGAFECHSKVNSLCEVLIMCNSPNYKEYCIKVAGLNKNEINEIADSVKLNN
jgi:lipase ATG15